MATSVHDICNGAYQELGVVALEETASAAELNGARKRLNELLETWQTETLTCYGTRFSVFPLSPSQASYTLGAGGDFSTDRPATAISQAKIRDAQGNDYDCDITTDPQDFANITSKYTTTSLPSLIYDDGGFPLRKLTFWPIPSDGSFSVVLWMLSVLSGFDSLSDPVIVPPGYLRALRYNLAVELAPSNGIKMTEDEPVAILAANSKAQLKRGNYRINTLMIDPAINGAANRPFNWLTGQ